MISEIRRKGVHFIMNETQAAQTGTLFGESCLVCKPAVVDLTPYKRAFKAATASVEEALYALGADFLREVQPSFLKFFGDRGKYPLLTELFQKACPNIKALGLSMKNPIAFTVDHVHVDSGLHARSPQLRMNCSPETYLKERGYL
jgi:hypothetical protein